MQTRVPHCTTKVFLLLVRALSLNSANVQKPQGGELDLLLVYVCLYVCGCGTCGSHQQKSL